MDSVYLISNASLEAHNNNTLTKFINVFESPLTLPPGKWEVTLDTIIVNPTFCNIPEITGEHIMFFKLLHFKAPERTEMVKVGGFVLPPRDYTQKSLLTEMKHQMCHNPQCSLMAQFKITVPTDEAVFKAFKEQRPYDKLTGLENVQEFNTFQKKYQKQNTFFNLTLTDNNNVVAIHHTLSKILGFLEKPDNPEYPDYVMVRTPNIYHVSPFRLKPILPKYLHVEVSNVDCDINPDYRSIISTHALEMISPNMHYRQFEQTHGGVITTDRVRDFKVRILDDNYKQLRIGSGQPTILKMNFQKYDSNEGSFSITVKSGNNKTDFSHMLQPPIHLSEDYMCALSSITYPTRFNNVPIKDKIYIYREKFDGEIITIVKDFNPEKKKISNIYDLIKQINMDCHSDDDAHFTWQGYIADPNMKEERVQYNSQLLFMTLQDNSATEPTTLEVKTIRYAEYDLPGEIGLLLGQPVVEGRWRFTTPDGGLTTKFLTTPNFNLLIPNNMFLYTNFTNLVYMGGDLTSLLHIVPIKHVQQAYGYVTEEPRHLNYIQVRHKTLNNLKFQLLTAAGDPISFERDDDTVSLTLKFVRKK